MIRKLFLSTLLVLTLGELFAQDPQFSQFYAQPLYLNPGFAGTTEQYRLIGNSRIQWPSLPEAFHTYALSFDYNMSNINSGLGILLMTDKMGSASLRSTSVNLMYTYKIQLRGKWIISPGIQVGYAIRDINIQRLLFGDQLDPNFAGGQTPISIDPAIARIGNTSYFDISTGVVAYNEMVWVGFAAHHLNQPDEAFTEGGDSQLPIKYSAHAGVKIPLYKGPRKIKTSSLSPSINYRRQAQFDQMDIGLAFDYSPIKVGVWYRGIPVQQNAADNLSQDAITFLFGLVFPTWEMGYSYDITVSELGPNAGGAHELSLRYEFTVQRGRRVRRKEKFIPCPTF